MGQILRLSSCYIVNQETDNFDLHQYVRDMNEFEYDRLKYTNHCVSGFCIRILHFV